MAVSAVGIFGTTAHISSINEDAKHSIQAQLNMQKALYDKIYPGDWAVKDGKLYKGEQLMNDNNEVVDIVFNSTNGNLSTLFLGDTRVATSVKDESGKRKVNTKASGPVVEKVLNKGIAFVGAANVADTVVYSAYEPIKDKEGKTIGMIYIGDPKAQGQIDDTIRKSVREAVLISAAIMVITLLLTMLFAGGISRRLTRAQLVLGRIAEGDLTAEPLPTKGRDEIDLLAVSINTMSKDLKSMVLSIHEASLQMAASSEELSASTEESNASTEYVSTLTERLAGNAEEQLGVVKETGTTVEEMQARFGRITKLSGDVNGKMDEAKDLTENGYLQGKKVLEQMREIQNTTETTFEAIGKLEERSQEIGGIAATMANLSKQTNLLALNASIEASRAGESGRGFAVVAGEIRKLAEQSSVAAAKVRELVESILNITDQAAKAIEADKEAVSTGVVVADRVNTTFTGIQVSFDIVKDKMKEVSASLSRLQAGGTAISERMVRVKATAEMGVDATQQVAATCQEQLAVMVEIATAAQSLAGNADGLQAMLLKFKL
ncbi:methyl-accepting chemotaxis protein [Gorillibacterium massiliense]|uniref:methyl-accepting chemotaxis protein n=1 Tax=Gorillibacterium massiliense TaxID=1280390 RepID=UPI001EE27894|nr:methyl-accepting chemotaxis protein [Gorillibacterium massiliense]